MSSDKMIRLRATGAKNIIHYHILRHLDQYTTQRARSIQVVLTTALYNQPATSEKGACIFSDAEWRNVASSYCGFSREEEWTTYLIKLCEKAEERINRLLKILSKIPA